MSLKGLTILLVEDEAFIAMDLEDHLTDAGATVVGPVPTLGEAERVAREEEVDAAILDVMLGRDEVFPAADILQDRGIPFLFHSAHAEPERIHDAYPSVPLMPKPGDTEKLLGKLIAITAA